MGCWFAKSTPHHAKFNTETVKYSWDEKEKINPADFTIENVTKNIDGRLPGTIKGQQFIIQNCEDANIYLFDHSNTVTVDDCTRCNVFIGPVKGSVFVRNCQECKLMLACQQFRVRDCQKLDVNLCVTTQPIIESSIAVKFACFAFNYPELEGQFRSAGLSEYNNNWSDVHDFTPVEGERNWSLTSDEVKNENNFPLPNSAEFAEMKISANPSDSFVPQTAGIHKRLSDEGCLVVFLSDGQSHERAKSFIHALRSSQHSGHLIHSKEVYLEATNAKAVFNTESYSQVVARGPVIGLEYNGDGCLEACQSTAMSIAKETGSTGLVYVSSNAKSAAKQIELFFNYANMQMS